MITQTLTTSFKVGLLLGEFSFASAVLTRYKIALYSSTANLNADTTVYTTTGEITGTGYVAGGKYITPTIATSSGTTAYVSFSDTSWTGASFTAAGALIYDTTQANASIAVLSFGGNKTPGNGTFTIQFPANTSTTAIIRIA